MISIKKEEKASISVKRILGICLLVIFLSGMGALAANTGVNNVKIVLANDCEINSLTSKTKVSEILDEKHIILLPDEKVIPGMEEEIGDNKTITILKASEQEAVMEIAQNTSDVTMEQILKAYAPITEKIVTEQIEIPFETITKDAANGEKETTNKVLQQGKNGLKEVTYKVKYQNQVEIEKTEISSNIIREPVNKVVQLKAKQVSNRSMNTREANSNPAATSSSSLASRVAGKTPSIVTMNTSAYCACSKCCGKSNGITGSGAKATAWYTVAAGSGYPIGTVIYIPALKNKPNGGWFVVQDRGGAISNSRIDIFMGSHNQALSFGRKSLECYVYK